MKPALPPPADGWPAIAELVPHAAPMCLLDTVLAIGPDWIRTGLAIRKDGPFCNDGRVGAWVGIEYMAQSAAALAGWEARQQGAAVRPGFLVGARRYLIHQPWFHCGEVLRIEAVRESGTGDGGLALLHGRIEAADGRLLAESTLSVFQPDRPETGLTS
ncbi:hypothetical protein N8I74_02970 [Chitiniphilus purpureus]|uniref:3-hydroxylacyl-ACP dehydratase n=1 Tax=Chitiniphilus purpureus TaxID=2981137 RepID=A0ABY6DNR7_9NEIS|nr:hypothetical protein [Chitiniphilus sp. CD1]UXY15997.1 hypothetical protein N8I74_02970 [Chitiniphilus sp. CD1]